MNNVTVIPTEAAANAAWEHYAALSVQMTDNPKLHLSRPHVEAMLRAHTQFADAFNKLERAA